MPGIAGELSGRIGRDGGPHAYHDGPGDPRPGLGRTHQTTSMEARRSDSTPAAENLNLGAPNLLAQVYLTGKFRLPRQIRIFMENTSKYRFSEPVTTFHGSRLPERATPVGYAALIDALGLKVPMPRTLSAIGPRHKSYQQDVWQI